MPDALSFGWKPECGGCQGEGRHRRWCPHVVGVAAAHLGRLAEEAESLGDRIGPNNMGAANLTWRAASELRQDAQERAKAYMEQHGTSH